MRRDTGERHQDFLIKLAQASGTETRTRANLACLDRKRKQEGSNDDCTHPHDPDARIAKMKDGRTHLSHQAEHVVDLQPTSRRPSPGLASVLAIGQLIRERSAEDWRKTGPFMTVVRKGGFEPPRSCDRQPLKLVRLPVPPLPQLLRAAIGNLVSW